MSKPKNQSFLEKKNCSFRRNNKHAVKKQKTKKNAYKCKYIKVKKENIEEDGVGKRSTSKPHQEG